MSKPYAYVIDWGIQNNILGGYCLYHEGKPAFQYRHITSSEILHVDYDKKTCETLNTIYFLMRSHTYEKTRSK